MMEKTSPTPKICSQNPSLPDDLLISCMARVSRLHYPTLSLVSKIFRSLVASPELYKARSLSGHTESCLYVCLDSSSDCRWFTLYRKPDQSLTNGDTSKKKKNKKSSGYVLATVSVLQSGGAGFPGLVAVGSDIYNIQAIDYHVPSSSNASVMDCRFHTWHEAPSMRVEKESLSACVVDRKIYVGGIHEDSSENSFEVFDTETQTWDPLPLPCSNTGCCFYKAARSACINGKIHVCDDENMVCYYDPKEGRWDIGQPQMSLRNSDGYCEIGNVLYTVWRSELRWYDSKASFWRYMEGLVRMPEFPRGGGFTVRLADYGGKMAVLWDENLPCSDEKVIWCAVITLKKRKRLGIWGEVEWFGRVLTVPKSYYFIKVLAAIV